MGNLLVVLLATEYQQMETPWMDQGIPFRKGKQTQCQILDEEKNK